MLGTALGKPVFSTGTGEDWVRVQQRNDVTRVQRWIATSYAFGQYFMYAYNKWGFSEETGTQWYQVPITVYEPLCRFITENAGLFDDFEPVAQVGLVYDNASCRNNDWIVRDICRDMHYANIPAGLVISGDSWLKYQTAPDQMEQFELLIAPSLSALSGEKNKIFHRLEEEGRLIEWTGIDEICSRITPMVSLRSGENVWILPRKKHGEDPGTVVIHLLNQDYDPVTDSMKIKNDIGLFISSRLTNNIPAKKATIFIPDNEPMELQVKPEGDGVVVYVPVLELWALLKLGSN